MCVGEAGRAVTQLVREAAGLKKQRNKPNGTKSSKSDGSAFAEAEPPFKSESPRSSTSSSRGSDRGNSFTQSLRDLFSAGAYRESSLTGSRRGSQDLGSRRVSRDLAAGVEDGSSRTKVVYESEAGDRKDVGGRPFRHEGAKLHESWGEYDYDESLQEDLFMERVFFPIPVQNTFIHYNTAEEDASTPTWLSSPAKLLNKSFHTIWPAHEEAHYQNRCRPCAYHLYKRDGCRLGNECTFCHLCKRGEIKKRKKEKARGMRVAREARQMAGEEKKKKGDSSGCSLIPDGSDGHPDEESSSGSGNESPTSPKSEARNQGA